MNITIVGTGYVGLVSAAVFADLGHEVICLDVDEEKIKRLNNGEPLIFEDGLAEIMQKNKGRLKFTVDLNEAYKYADVVFICVGTPENKDGSANLTFVYKAVDQIIISVSHDTVLVIKSTVPIGTNDKIQRYIDDNKACNFNIDIVSNPEFLSQGTALKNMLNPDRIIIGTDNQNSQEVMKEVYEKMNSPIIFTDRCSAEMIKYASNDFLALKISYINEIANLCELFGANINDVSKGMGMDPRIGDKFLNAGIGYGGSCFPKDTKALCSLAESYGYELKTVKAAIEVNEKQKLRLLEKSREYYDSLKDLNVAVLGLTFKPGTDDLREAPSLVNIPLMLDEGANVKVWDPVGIDNFKQFIQENKAYDENKLQYCSTPREALNEADICFIFTEWEDIKRLEKDDFLKMNKPVILDGRNCLNRLSFSNEEVCYLLIGN